MKFANPYKKKNVIDSEVLFATISDFLWLFVSANAVSNTLIHSGPACYSWLYSHAQHCCHYQCADTKNWACGSAPTKPAFSRSMKDQKHTEQRPCPSANQPLHF